MMAIAEFINPDSGSYIRLDAVESFNKTLTSQLTKHPVESGSDYTDHVVVENQVVQFTGIISEIKFRNGLLELFSVPETADKTLSPQDFVTEVEEVILSRVPFDLYLDEDLETLENCIITSFDILRNPSIGKSFKVSISVEQIRVATQAEATTVEAPNEEFAKEGTDTEDKGGQATEQVGETIFSKAVSSGFDLTGKAVGVITGGI